MNVFLLTLLSSLSHAVPLQMNHQGRIEDADGNGLVGEHELVFKIYDDESGGNVLWTETISESFNNGYYSVILGTDEESNPLDEGILKMHPLWLELTVDNGDPMSPRHEIVSTPYAQMAGTAQNLDGGSVDATDVSINGTQVIDANGSWVGAAPNVDWSGVANIPSGFADGVDDDTLASLSTCNAGELVSWDGQGWVCVSDNTLTEADIENFVTNGAINLYDGSTMGGSALLTSATTLSPDWNNIQNRPSGLDDGDDDTQLPEATVEGYVTNAGIDLHADTTIGGQSISTTDNDTLGNLSCTVTGEVAKWDDTLQEWYCDVDMDTQLSETEVEGYVTNGAVNLYDGTTLGGNGILTTTSTLSPNWSNIQNRPAGLDDGDDDTQLSSTEVVGYVEAGSVNLASGSTMDGNSLLTTADTLSTDWSNIQNRPAGLDDGDDDTQLTASEVQGIIELLTVLNLPAGTTLDGNAILTSASTLSPDWSNVQNRPAGLDDGDDDTQLSAGDVVGYVQAGSVNLAAGSMVASKNIVGQPSGCTNGQVLVFNSTNNDWECGDDSDTTLTPAEMQGLIEGLSLNLQNLPQVNGSPVLTADSIIDPTKIDVSGSTVGQVLVSDGSHLNWGDNQANNSCQETINNHYDGSFYVSVDCDSYSYVLKTGGAINFWNSPDTCTFSYVEYQDNGVHTLVDCGASTYVLSGSHQSSIKANSLALSNSFTENYHCAVTQTDSVKCWGYDDDGQISNIPSDSFKSLNLGYYFSCGITDSDEVKCWGSDWSNQASNAPTGTFESLSLGAHHACGIKTNGTISCWGYDYYGQVSNAPAGTFTDLTSGYRHNCALDTNGEIKCWGYSSYGLLSNIPAGSFSKLYSGYYHSCALRSNGDIQCWGYDDEGHSSGFPSISFNSLSLGAQHTCGIDASGLVHCWGYSVAVENIPTDTFTHISAGYRHTCGITTNGQIRCWGVDSHGQVSNAPITGSFIGIQSNQNSSCALLTTGNVICWGNTDNGQTTPP